MYIDGFGISNYRSFVDNQLIEDLDRRFSNQLNHTHSKDAEIFSLISIRIMAYWARSLCGEIKAGQLIRPVSQMFSNTIDKGQVDPCILSPLPAGAMTESGLS